MMYNLEKILVLVEGGQTQVDHRLPALSNAYAPESHEGTEKAALAAPNSRSSYLNMEINPSTSSLKKQKEIFLFGSQ